MLTGSEYGWAKVNEEAGLLTTGRQVSQVQTAERNVPAPGEGLTDEECADGSHLRRPSEPRKRVQVAATHRKCVTKAKGECQTGAKVQRCALTVGDEESPHYRCDDNTGFGTL